jgi:hypothetical protein
MFRLGGKIKVYVNRRQRGRNDVICTSCTLREQERRCRSFSYRELVPGLPGSQAMTNSGIVPKHRYTGEPYLQDYFFHPINSVKSRFYHEILHFLALFASLDLALYCT